ncbi:MAG: hypothetical protein K0Q95_1704 [Bacteroidota bacterium]|jgi:hypothetical protein|nr:hypothetical protein [Bacteroidota bacterium]
MKKSAALLLFLFLRFAPFAQTSSISLPVVGDTIDYQEKIKYLLFEDIPSAEYQFSVLSKRNYDTVVVHYLKNDTIIKKADEKYIALAKIHIIKLNNYYTTINQKAHSDPIPKNSLVVNPSVQKDYPFQERRLDSLLTTNPKDYKAIRREEKKERKKSSKNYVGEIDRRTDKEKTLQQVGIEKGRMPMGH